MKKNTKVYVEGQFITTVPTMDCESYLDDLELGWGLDSHQRFETDYSTDGEVHLTVVED